MYPQEVRTLSERPSLARRWLAIFFVLSACLFAPQAWAATDPPIEVMYHERPPYYISRQDGHVGGLVGGPTDRAFKKAHIPFKWVLVAANRHLRILQANKSRVCAVGWFKNPTREKFAKYTAYIHQDKPMVAIILAENKAVRQNPSAAQLLSDKGLVMGKKLGYSYGRYIDGIVEKQKTRTITSTQSDRGLILMLLAKRFDYAFFPGDEVSSIVARTGKFAARLAILSPQDMPTGDKRYILCSRRVDDKTIQRLNTAIETVRQ